METRSSSAHISPLQPLTTQLFPDIFLISLIEVTSIVPTTSYALPPGESTGSGVNVPDTSTRNPTSENLYSGSCSNTFFNPYCLPSSALSPMAHSNVVGPEPFFVKQVISPVTVIASAMGGGVESGGGLTGFFKIR